MILIGRGLDYSKPEQKCRGKRVACRMRSTKTTRRTRSDDESISCAVVRVRKLPEQRHEAESAEELRNAFERREGTARAGSPGEENAKRKDGRARGAGRPGNR